MGEYWDIGLYTGGCRDIGLYMGIIGINFGIIAATTDQHQCPSGISKNACPP